MTTVGCIKPNGSNIAAMTRNNMFNKQECFQALAAFEDRFISQSGTDLIAIENLVF